jgi:hypothetical protein
MARELRTILLIMAVALVIGAPLIFAAPGPAPTNYLALVLHLVVPTALPTFTPITGTPINPGTATAIAATSVAGTAMATTPTVTRTPTPTHVSLSPTPTPTHVPVTLLANGDFEQGAVLWTPQPSANTSIITNPPAPVTPRSGTHVAQFAALQPGTGGAEIDQTNVVVPADKPYLSYWVWIRSTEPLCGFDVGGVGIDSTTIDRFNLCVATQTDGWVHRSLDLSAQAGQTVTVILIADTLDVNPPNSVLYIDDVGWRSVP